MSKIKKKCDTSIRVLQTLKLLTLQALSIQEIIHYFEKIDPKKKIYTSEVILKYINTLKVFGFKFEKDKDKYVLINAYPKFDLSLQELNALKILEHAACEFPEEIKKKNTISLIHSIERRFSDETIELKRNMKKPSLRNLNFYNEKQCQMIKKLEKYCIDGFKIKICYKTSPSLEMTITAEPKEISYIKNNAYFRIYNPTISQNQEIRLVDIIKIEQLPQKANPITMPSSSTFLLKDRLAKAYILKENERMLTSNPDGSIVIINQGEDRTKLLKRLMRYAENCEILSPKSLREEIRNSVRTMLNSY